MKALKVKETVFQPGRPKVAVPLVGTTPEDIISECEEVKKLPCQIIEWRADYFLSAIDNLDSKLQEKDIYLEIIKILDDINLVAEELPVIFTLRSKSQGGMVQLTNQQERSIWQLVTTSGLADFIDIELYDGDGNLDEDRITSQVEDIHNAGGYVILSHHDFNRMPPPGELVSIVQIMARMDADICKIAAMASNKTEATNLLKATAFLTKKDIGPVALMAMGEEGKSTRVAAGKYGSCITFASGAGESAPGQVDTHTMKKWLDEYYGEE